MKKINVILIVLILISTLFIPVSQAGSQTQNSFYKIQNGPFSNFVEFLKNIPFINQIINFFQNLFGIENTGSEDSNNSEDNQKENQSFIERESDSIRDSTNDIMHYEWNDGRYRWRMNRENKPNIDITKIKYAIGENKVRLSLTVDGSIVHSEMISYHMHFNTSESYYYFIWVNGEGIGIATSIDGNTFQGDIAPDISVSGNTITATYDVSSTSTKVEELWGFAAEYTEYGDTSAEWWVDYAPNEESPYSTETKLTKGNVSNGTPGFEILVLFIALSAILLYYKKSK